jgi:hypothetical protein
VYEHYKPGSSEENFAARSLQYYYQFTSKPGIILCNPLQIRVLDALTEAVGIPHERGMAEIEIPEKLRHYNE